MVGENGKFKQSKYMWLFQNLSQKKKPVSIVVIQKDPDNVWNH